MLVIIAAAGFVAILIGRAISLPADMIGGQSTIAGHGVPVGGIVLLVFLTAGLCEYVDSSIGMGFGTTLTPVLLLAGIEPERLVPAVLASEMLTGLAAAAMHHRDGNVDWLRDRRRRHTVLLLSGMVCLGAIAAPLVALHLSRSSLGAAVAGVLIAMSVFLLATRHRRIAWRPAGVAAVGLIASFCKALTGGGYGPLVTGGQILSGVPAPAAVAVTCLSEAFVCGVALLVYGCAGRTIEVGLLLPLLAGALCSVPLSTLTVGRVREARLRFAVAIGAGVLGVAALVRQFG